MTTEQYEELKKWCLSTINKGRADYAAKFALKKDAVRIWLAINSCRGSIKLYFRALERSTDEQKIAYYRSRLEECKELKRQLMKEFDDLKYF